MAKQFKVDNDTLITGDLDVTQDVTVTGNLDVTTDVTITGDLTVNGTETIINTTDLNVTDSNIVINDGGSDASSEGAGITIERTSTDGSFIYEDALASKFKLGAAGSEIEVANVSSTQTFLNKTLTSPTIDTPALDGGSATDTNKWVVPKNTNTNLTALTREEGAVYYDTTNSELVVDDGASLTTIGGGATTELDNLGTTAINASLVPDSDVAYSLGGPSRNWFIMYSKFFLSNEVGSEFGTDFNSGLGVTFRSGAAGGGVTTGTTTFESGPSLSFGTAATGNSEFRSGAIGNAANTSNTGDVTLQSGNTVGTGNSGDLTIKTGSVVSGTQGDILLQDGSEGTAGHVWTSTDTSGTGNWQVLPSSNINGALSNLGLTGSMAANAFTIELKQFDGSTDPTSANPVKIAYRSGTITSGASEIVDYTSALSIVIPSTATLNHEDGLDNFVYVYGIYDGTFNEIAVIGSPGLDEGKLYNTTAISASADSFNTLYSTTARTNVRVRYLGRFKVNQATAGTWVTAPSAVEVSNGTPVTHTDWLECNLTTNWTGTETAYWRKEGVDIHVMGKLVLTADPGTLNLIADLPFSLTRANSKFPGVENYRPVGSGAMHDSSAVNEAGPILVCLGAATDEVILRTDTASSTLFSIVDGAAGNPFNVDIGDIVVFEYKVPVSDWDV